MISTRSFLRKLNESVVIRHTLPFRGGSWEEMAAMVTSARFGLQDKLFNFRQSVALLIPNFLAAFVLQKFASSSAFWMKADS